MPTRYRWIVDANRARFVAANGHLTSARQIQGAHFLARNDD
jgi:hypothetical protein